MRRLDCHNRIKQVKSDYETALRIMQVFIELAIQEPEHLHNNNLDLHEMRALASGLHDVYFVRMFASFESSLRHYWRALQYIYER